MDTTIVSMLDALGSRDLGTTSNALHDFTSSKSIHTTALIRDTHCWVFSLAVVVEPGLNDASRYI